MTVTVVIPNWNCAHYVYDAVMSVHADPAVSEIIVVDNASTDGSMQLLEKLPVPTLKILQNAENVGAARARDQAVHIARNDLICFLDADDMLSPDAISHASRRLSFEDADLSIFHMIKLEPDGSKREVVPVLRNTITGQEAFRRTVGGWGVHAMGVLRRSVYLEARRTFDFHGYSDDELLTRHILWTCRSVTGVPDRYIYRFVPKKRSFARSSGQVQTEAGVLRMASAPERDVPLAQLQHVRAHVVRGTVGLLRWPYHLVRERASILGNLKEVQSLQLPWRSGDVIYRLALVTLLLGFSLLPSAGAAQLKMQGKG